MFTFHKSIRSHFQNTFSLWCGSYNLLWKSQDLYKQTCSRWRSQAERVQVNCLRVTWPSHEGIEIRRQSLYFKSEVLRCVINSMMSEKKNQLVFIQDSPSTLWFEEMMPGCQAFFSTGQPVISANLLNFQKF